MTGFEMALLMNTGAEAVESAIKLARKWAYKVSRVGRFTLGPEANASRDLTGQGRRGGQGNCPISGGQLSRADVS
jgi:hypothetical protein